MKKLGLELQRRCWVLISQTDLVIWQWSLTPSGWTARLLRREAARTGDMARIISEACGKSAMLHILTFPEAITIHSTPGGETAGSTEWQADSGMAQRLEINGESIWISSDEPYVAAIVSDLNKLGVRTAFVGPVHLLLMRHAARHQKDQKIQYIIKSANNISQLVRIGGVWKNRQIVVANEPVRDIQSMRAFWDREQDRRKLSAQFLGRYAETPCKTCFVSPDGVSADAPDVINLLSVTKPFWLFNPWGGKFFANEGIRGSLQQAYWQNILAKGSAMLTWPLFFLSGALFLANHSIAKNLILQGEQIEEVRNDLHNWESDLHFYDELTRRQDLRLIIQRMESSWLGLWEFLETAADETFSPWQLIEMKPGNPLGMHASWSTQENWWQTDGTVRVRMSFIQRTETPRNVRQLRTQGRQLASALQRALQLDYLPEVSIQSADPRQPEITLKITIPG